MKKAMKKTMKFLSMAALALVGAVMTGCSSDEDGFTDTPQQPAATNYSVTKTLRVSLDGGEAGARGITRALTSGGVKTFAVGDKLAITYTKAEDGMLTKVETEALKADDISDDGKSATFTVTFTKAPKTDENRNELTYIYPASIATNDGYIDNSQLNSQDGTLATLASNLDACRKYTKWDGGDLPALTLTNAFTIGKFIIKNPSGTAINDELTSVTISDGANTYTITPTGSTFTSDPIWVAMQPISAGTPVTVTATDGTNNYSKSITIASGKDLLAGKIYPINVTVYPTPAPTGAINGKFTINGSGDQVYFSQGNLQATTSDLGANWSWAFAANQWDYIGNNTANNKINGNGTVSENGTVDLFGWVGASSDWTGAALYGISSAGWQGGYGTSTTDALKSDWGNTIGSGWRTLTKDEWYYLFSTRTSGSTVFSTSQARYTAATINTDGTGVNGIILFPDGVNIASSEVTTAGTVNGASNWTTKCTTAQWTALEAKGCVFLPAAGYRYGTDVNDYYVGGYGYYWSSTAYESDANYAYNVSFFEYDVYPAEYCDRRDGGNSVRLVKDAN